MLGLGEVRRRGESYVAVRQKFWTDSYDGLRIGMVRGESLRDERGGMRELIRKKNSCWRGFEGWRNLFADRYSKNLRKKAVRKTIVEQCSRSGASSETRFVLHLWH